MLTYSLSDCWQCSYRTTPSSPATTGGRISRDHAPLEKSMHEIIAFGGITDPVTAGRRVSSRIQEQPDADDLQFEHAMRAAKLRDVEATTGMSFNKS